MQIQFDPSVSLDTLISVGALMVTIVGSVVGGVYALTNDSKKYELTVAYKSEILNWYEKTVGILCRIIHLLENGMWSDNDMLRVELLSELSAQIEVGRFHFPNGLRESLGKEKHSAYQGRRQAVLDHLIDFYDAAHNGTINPAWLKQYERRFTSDVFEVIDPRKRTREYCKYTGIRMPEPKSKWERMEEDPEYSQRK